MTAGKGRQEKVCGCAENSSALQRGDTFLLRVRFTISGFPRSIAPDGLSGTDSRLRLSPQTIGPVKGAGRCFLSVVPFTRRLLWTRNRAPPGLFSPCSHAYGTTFPACGVGDLSRGPGQVMAGDAVQPRIGGTLPRPAQPPETRLSPGSVGPVPPFVGVRSGDYAVRGEVLDRFRFVRLYGFE